MNEVCVVAMAEATKTYTFIKIYTSTNLYIDKAICDSAITHQSVGQ